MPDGSLAAEGEITGVATSPAQRATIMKAIAKTETAKAEAAMRIAPGTIKPSFPINGTVTGLILLCEFQDVKFTGQATREHYDAVCNTTGYSSEATRGSVVDYFTSQSDGKFTPKFDIFGTVTLPYDRAHYGLTNDVNNLFRDAALEADRMGLDFSKYDINNDGFVDFLFVIFAGHGQAQGGPYDSVWPAMQDLSEYVFDYFDGLNLGVAACSCELKGGSGANLDGIGTICHEFSHILGLADIYDTSQQGAHGMGHFDIMDRGTYNDNQVTPSGYTAMDKYTLGWITPTVLDGDAKDVTLDPFDTSHQAVFIVNPENVDEYYTLENRQIQGWDSGLPGHGLVISYCHYEPHLWRRNTVNAVAAGYEHVHIIAADNVWDEIITANEAGDPFPGTSAVTSFSAYTAPKATWRSTGKDATFCIKNIRETEDGRIIFDFIADTASIESIGAYATGNAVSVAGNTIIAPASAEIFDLCGRRCAAKGLLPGVYVVKTSATTTKVIVK